MTLIRNFALMVSFLTLSAQPTSACVRPWSYIAGGATTALGAFIVGMGGLLTKYAQDDDAVIASHYVKTALSVKNYSIDQVQCVTRSGRSTYYHPYTATCKDEYDVQSGNTTEKYYVDFGWVCGDTPDQALANVQSTYPIGNWWPIYYMIADHNSWQFRLPSSSFWGGAITLYTVGGIVFLLGVASTLMLVLTRPA